MFKIKKQIYSILTISGLSSFQIAGASWVALLASRGFSLIEIGFAESCFHLVSFLCEVPSGVVADVFGRKRSMIISQCMFILSAFLMIFSDGIVGVCIAIGIDALGYNFSSGTREALAYDSLKAGGCEERYLEFSSIELMIYRIGNGSALICAGLALNIGYRYAYFIDVMLGLICLYFSFQLKEVVLEEKQFEGTIGYRVRKCFNESLYFLTHNPKEICLMLWNAFVGAVAILTVFFLQSTLTSAGLSNRMLGPALFFVSMGGVAGAKLVLKTADWNYRKLSLGCICGVFVGIFCGSIKAPVMMCLGGFLASMCDDVLQVHTDAILNERFPSSQRATLVSVSSLCFSIVMIVLSPLAGWFFSVI